MPVLATVGAGPGMGLAIARTLGANDWELHTEREGIEKVITPSGGEAGR